MGIGMAMDRGRKFATAESELVGISMLCPANKPNPIEQFCFHPPAARRHTRRNSQSHTRHPSGEGRIPRSLLKKKRLHFGHLLLSACISGSVGGHQMAMARGVPCRQICPLIGHPAFWGPMRSPVTVRHVVRFLRLGNPCQRSY